jgi:hypothetical protein
MLLLKLMLNLKETAISAPLTPQSEKSKSKKRFLDIMSFSNSYQILDHDTIV